MRPTCAQKEPATCKALHFPIPVRLDLAAFQRCALAGRDHLGRRRGDESGGVHGLHQALWRRRIHLDAKSAARQPHAGAIHRERAAKKIVPPGDRRNGAAADVRAASLNSYEAHMGMSPLCDFDRVGARRDASCDRAGARRTARSLECRSRRHLPCLCWRPRAHPLTPSI